MTGTFSCASRSRAINLLARGCSPAGQPEHSHSLGSNYSYSIVSILFWFGGRVKFEFDDAKNETNRAKHGIDFVEAQDLWLDEMFVEFPLHIEDEARYAVVGLIKIKDWTAIITYRPGHIRLISVRRSRPEEVSIYENQGL